MLFLAVQRKDEANKAGLMFGIDSACYFACMAMPTNLQGFTTLARRDSALRAAALRAACAAAGPSRVG